MKKNVGASLHLLPSVEEAMERRPWVSHREEKKREQRWKQRWSGGMQ
jgi:hypothetical protein